MTLPEGLFDAVKNYLDVTWELSSAEQSKLEGIIKRGISYLNRVAGAKMDYTAEDIPRALLMDYVRYIRSNAFDEFQANYLHELLSLQITREVGGFDTPEDADV